MTAETCRMLDKYFNSSYCLLITEKAGGQWAIGPCGVQEHSLGANIEGKAPKTKVIVVNADKYIGCNWHRYIFKNLLRKPS